MHPRARAIAIAAAALAAAALLCLYAWVDPAQTWWMPKCAFRALTGWDCPGCGAQRALHALLRGDVAQAWRANPYFLIAVPAAAALGLIEARREAWPRLYAAVYRPALFYAILALTVGWCVARNLLPLTAA